MSNQPLNVLISGAGIAGTTAALCLARQPNFILKPKITIIERSATPRTTGQAIDIRGPGVYIIRELGLEQRIKERHTGETGTAWVNSKGESVAHFDMTGNAEKQSATSEYEILRGELAGLLLEELEIAKRDEGAEVEFVCGEKIETLKEDEDGVAVTFANGKLSDQKFDVVIAADGVSSKTRHMMFPTHYREDGTDVTKPWGMYIGFFTVPRIEGDTDIWKWYNQPGGLSVHVRPHRNKKTMGVYLSLCEPHCVRSPEIEEALAQGVPAQKALLRQRFAGAGWQVDRFLKDMEESDDFYMSPIAMVVTPTWTSSRCAMVGDAAYCMMGMGTSLAMIGGYMIAGELAKAHTTSTSEIGAALNRYEDGLKPFVRKTQWKPPGVPQIMNPQTQWGITVLHCFLWLVGKSGIASWLISPGEGKTEGWKAPDYGWAAAREEKLKGQ